MQTEDNASKLALVEHQGQIIDQLITIDFPRRGVIDLISEEVRNLTQQSVSLAAATLLRDNLKRGSVVLIATGWLDRPHINTSIAESDGPPGAAVLARALHVGLGAVPLILVEEEIVQATIQTVQAAGLRCVSPQEAVRAVDSPASIHAASVIALPKNYADAKALTMSLCDEFDVGAFIAIEKGGMNDRQRIHTSRGHDTTDALGKADAVLEVCTDRGIHSVAIGDGGNELGMGKIRSGLMGRLRFSENCQCDCQGGVVPIRPVDVLVPATVSNWGAYGVGAALACLLDDPNILQTLELEESILRASAAAGFIDGVSGYVAPTADGLPLKTQLAVVTMLRAVFGFGVKTDAWI